MERNDLVKVVYEDNGERVLKGYILKEDEHTITVQINGTSKSIILGKRALIKISGVE